MAPAARIAFMKRFVLLNEAGKPSVTTNPSGRPIVRCDTPAGAAEIQIGGADTRDNVAFMPVMLRDATDTTDASAIQVNMGLVRENGEWKILSLGVVLLDLPSLGIGMGFLRKLTKMRSPPSNRSRTSPKLSKPFAVSTPGYPQLYRVWALLCMVQPARIRRNSWIQIWRRE